MSTNKHIALRRLLAGSTLILVSAPVMAHPGHDERDHLVSGIDPLLLTAIVATMAVVIGVLAVRLIRPRSK